MTRASDFVGCVPLWLVTKIAESVVQLDSPVGGPPSHSPSEVYSRRKLCVAAAVFASWFTLFTTGTLPALIPLFFSLNSFTLSSRNLSTSQCAVLCSLCRECEQQASPGFPLFASRSFVSISVCGSSVVFFLYHENLNELGSVSCSLLLFIFQDVDVFVTIWFSPLYL